MGGVLRDRGSRNDGRVYDLAVRQNEFHMANGRRGIGLSRASVKRQSALSIAASLDTGADYGNCTCIGF